MRRNIILTAILLMTVMLASCASGNSGAISASGVIETAEVAVAAEVSGRVQDIPVTEGQAVKAGDVLFILEGSLLRAQKGVAEATLSSAQAAVDAAQVQYDLALQQALSSSNALRAGEWSQAKDPQFDLPNWYYNQGEQIAAARAAIDTSREDLGTVQDELAGVEKQAGSKEFIQAETTLANARMAFELSKSLKSRAENASSGQYLRDEAKAIYEDAKAALNNAQAAYDKAATSDQAREVLKARAKVSVAREKVALAEQALMELQYGEFAPQVLLADSALTQARATLQQAQAQNELLRLQIEKLTVRAPQAGVVLTRSIQAGEVLQAGMTAMTLGDLKHLTVTVYIPESQYGRIDLGASASLTTDSFPGVTFNARVVRIADQAEFTPQNVQTSEGRQTTVYAVKLTVSDPEGRLKPGMPVEVSFGP